MPINVGNYENQVELLNRTNTIITDLSKAGKTPRRQTYFNNGTWVAPSGVTRVFVTGGGGGGGGGGSASTTVNGNSGGVTSFGTLLSLSGGGGGGGGNLESVRVGLPGGRGGSSGEIIFNAAGDHVTGNGGDSGPFKGGSTLFASSANSARNGDCCSGGSGFATQSTAGAAGGGGGGEFVWNKELTVVPGTTYDITIGNGGLGASGGGLYAGNGGNGILTLEWWE